MIILDPTETYRNAPIDRRDVHPLFDLVLLNFLLDEKEHLTFWPERSGWCRISSSREVSDDLPPMPGHLESLALEYFSSLFCLGPQSCSATKTVIITNAGSAIVQLNIAERSDDHSYVLSAIENSIDPSKGKHAVSDYFQMKWEEKSLLEKARYRLERWFDLTLGNP